MCVIRTPTVVCSESSRPPIGAPGSLGRRLSKRNEKMHNEALPSPQILAAMCGVSKIRDLDTEHGRPIYSTLVLRVRESCVGSCSSGH